MVQRKIPSKLGIQADHIKAMKQPANLKQYSLPSQNHDTIIKNRGGADLKKKMMKKSGKTKHEGSSRSPNFTRHVPHTGKPGKQRQQSPPQPGKPPPTQQQLQSHASAPNYMKSTSSSVARKLEQSQVSSRSPLTYSPDSRSPIRKNSNNPRLGEGPPSSANKPARSLARTCSLKLVRTTLTKTPPSFKPVKRVSAKKKSSANVLPEDFHVERATCSSTLKEAKFPTYLQLSPGGTESDGTSVFKVCPYTYCSLNGHHHPPLPPLKCFLSSRRRALKTRRNFKLGCRANPHGLGLGLNEDVPRQKLNATEVPPLANEDEFFLEIYSKGKEEMADAIGRNTNLVDDYDTTDSNLVPSDEGSEVAAKHSYRQLEESLSNGPQHSGEDNLDQKRKAISAEINIFGFCTAENLTKDEIHIPPVVQEEAGDFESMSMHTELQIEDAANELSSEASNMDWDADKYYAYIEDEMGSIPNVTEPIALVADSIVSEEFMEKSSDLACCNPELQSDNTLDESWDIESIISDTSYAYDDSQSACSHTEFACVEASDPQISPESSRAGSEDTSCDSLEVIFILDGEITEKPGEAFCLEDDISTSRQEECTTLQDDDATAPVGYQALNACNCNEVLDQTWKDNVGGQESSDENIVVKIEDAETKTDCCEQGNENDHGNNGEQLVMGADVKSKTNYEDHTSYQDETGNASCVEADPTAEACAEKLNRIKDAPSFKDKKIQTNYDLNEELSESYRNLRGTARRNGVKEAAESREFNPRPPNFLPLEADPEAEKVDLKHQMMDDRKNAEDWMLDFALRRAVDQLALARKRKVELLVEAFEKVMPTSKWEPHLRRSAAQFAHPRPIQACN